jgi:hypothetical protein
MPSPITVMLAASIVFLACSRTASQMSEVPVDSPNTPTTAATRTGRHHDGCPDGEAQHVKLVSARECVVARAFFEGDLACVMARPFAPDEPGSPGPRFVGLRPDSALARCGVRNGDRWLSVNGVPVSPGHMLEAYHSLRQGRRLIMKLLRDEREVTLAVGLTE